MNVKYEVMNKKCDKIDEDVKSLTKMCENISKFLKKEKKNNIDEFKVSLISLHKSDYNYSVFLC